MYVIKCKDIICETKILRWLIYIPNSHMHHVLSCKSTIAGFLDRYLFHWLSDDLSITLDNKTVLAKLQLLLVVSIYFLSLFKDLIFVFLAGQNNNVDFFYKITPLVSQFKILVPFRLLCWKNFNLVSSFINSIPIHPFE